MSGLERLLALHDQAVGPAVLKDDGRVRVTRVSYDGVSDAVVKEDRRQGARARLSRWVRGSRAERSAASARALAAAGFAVPEPLGVLRAGERRCYVARHVPGPTLQAAWAEGPPAERARLAVAAARLVAALRSAGFAIRDLKPPNLVVGRGGLVLVDLDDVRRRPLARPGDRAALRNLAALDAYGQLGAMPLGARTRWQALAAYAAAANAAPGTWRQALQRSRARRAAWRAACRPAGRVPGLAIPPRVD